MEKDELQLMMEDVEYKRFKPSHYWSKAFKLYNENNLLKVGMGCRPCYSKVLAYHITLNINK